jgi:hypothetical protein
MFFSYLFEPWVQLSNLIRIKCVKQNDKKDLIRNINAPIVGMKSTMLNRSEDAISCSAILELDSENDRHSGRGNR